MLLQGVDLRKCGGVKPIVVVHGWLASESSQCFARKTTVPPDHRVFASPQNLMSADDVGYMYWAMLL